MLPNFKVVITNDGLPIGVQQEIKEHVTGFHQEVSQYFPHLESENEELA